MLIKIALNSGRRYPATTDPWSVNCMVKLLKEKGAGNILVGDQGGFGTLQWTKDRKEGSSRQLAKTAGLLKVIEDSGAEPCFFEEYRLFRTGKSLQPSGHCQLSEAHGRTSP